MHLWLLFQFQTVWVLSFRWFNLKDFITFFIWLSLLNVIRSLIVFCNKSILLSELHLSINTFLVLYITLIKLFQRFLDLGRILFIDKHELVLTMIDWLDIARMVALLNEIIALNNVYDLVWSYHYILIQTLFLIQSLLFAIVLH